MSSSSSSIKVKFLIDRERKRVVLVEAGSAFVDVLFSFLTLPLGSIVRLLNKQSGLASLDNIYESVVQLDAEHLQTDACKEMLLYPWSAAALRCSSLKIKYIYELYPVLIYTCKERGCLIQPTLYCARTSKVPCGRCGKLMDYKNCWPEKTSDEGGIFVNDMVDFIITDDLRVMPSSFARGLSILRELQIEGASILEERVIDFGIKEAMNLLGRSLVSKNALTELCFPDACVEASGDSSFSNKDEIVAGEAEAEVEKETILELFLNKRNNEVLCAEVGEDFVNFLFSFLTFPLGSALGFFSDNMSPLGGCIHNLYSSAKSVNWCPEHGAPSPTAVQWTLIKLPMAETQTEPSGRLLRPGIEPGTSFTKALEELLIPNCVARCTQPDCSRVDPNQITHGGDRDRAIG